MKIKNYLGFTDGRKKPGKTRIEDTLDKSYSYNGKSLELDDNSIILKRKEFIIRVIQLGYTPEIMKNVITYNKRTGEPNKPKTEYRMSSEDSSWIITKTEHDFALYLIGNNLTTDKQVRLYIQKEDEKLAQEEQARLEEEKRLQEEIERQEQEEKQFDEWLWSEAINYKDEGKIKLMNEIFLYIIGNEASVNSYKLLVMIDNFDNPKCKEEIISWLHNDNIASIKTFEHITGLKLPRTNNKRLEYLNSITSEDFKGQIEFKPRKKPQTKKQEEFYKGMHTKEGLKYTKCLAEPIIKHGIEMFIKKEESTYNLSSAECGMILSSGFTKKECLDNLDDVIEKRGIDNVKKIIAEVVEKYGLSPRYEQDIA
ncbi:MAG TPA: hypothetical protein GXZ90_09920 [Clostridiales bacterium]|nr:hypothetical protein [Clostridiales bacterium]